MVKGMYKRTKEDKERRIKLLKELAKNRIGTHLSDETKKKIGEKNKIAMKEKWNNGTAYKIFNYESRKGKESPIKGKKWEEIYGKEKADELKKYIKDNKLNVRPKEKNPFYGKHHSKESIEKNRKAHLGIKRTKEWKEQASIRMKNNPPSLGKKYPKELYPDYGLRKIRKDITMPLQDSKIEIKIQNYLKNLNIEYYTHRYMNEIEHKYQCDIFIPSINLVIECDGDYWHKYPTGREIDHIRTKELIEKGFKVLRIWEHEIKVMNINDFKDKLL